MRVIMRPKSLTQSGGEVLPIRALVGSHPLPLDALVSDVHWRFFFARCCLGKVPDGTELIGKMHRLRGVVSKTVQEVPTR